jgi:hypothetical protein
VGLLACFKLRPTDVLTLTQRTNVETLTLAFLMMFFA